MKIDIHRRSHRIGLYAAAGAFLLIAVWLWFRTPTDVLERDVITTTDDRKDAEQSAVLGLEAEKAARARLEENHRKDRNAQEARITDLEERLRRQDADQRAQNARTLALLAERTQARRADQARIATAPTSELHARAAALVGELAAPDDTYRNVIALGRDRDQARDELEATRDELETSKQNRALLQQLADERKASLDAANRHYAEMVAQAKQSQETHAATLAELREKSAAEAEANAKLVRRLKGSRFWGGVKTGMKVGAGIGIGIAIGRVMN